MNKYYLFGSTILTLQKYYSLWKYDTFKFDKKHTESYILIIQYILLNYDTENISRTNNVTLSSY